MTNKKYTHSKTAIVRQVDKLRTRKRTAANFVTREKTFGAEFPDFGATLGVAYDQTNITKTNRNPSVT